MEAINDRIPVLSRPWLTEDLVAPTTKEEAPLGLGESIEYIVASIQDDKYTKAFRLGAKWMIHYFKYHMPMTKIAEREGVTSSLVSSYIHTAIKNLGLCEKFRKIFVYGLDEYYKTYAKGMADRAMRLGYESGYSARSREKLLARSREKLSRDSYIEDIMENQNISIRAFNIMKRNGISTIGDLLDTENDALKKLRNCGEKVYNELLELKETFKDLKEE
jgi:hypothetical protein